MNQTKPKLEISKNKKTKQFNHIQILRCSINLFCIQKENQNQIYGLYGTIWSWKYNIKEFMPYSQAVVKKIEVQLIIVILLETDYY